MKEGLRLVQLRSRGGAFYYEDIVISFRAKPGRKNRAEAKHRTQRNKALRNVRRQTVVAEKG